MINKTTIKLIYAAFLTSIGIGLIGLTGEPWLSLTTIGLFGFVITLVFHIQAGIDNDCP